MTGLHRKRKDSQRVVETSDYIAMMTRIFHGLGARIAEDPVALAHLADLQATFTAAVNRGIYEANKSAAHYSQNDIAAIMGVSQQAVSKRIKLGESAYNEYWQARADAAPLVRLGDVRARRAELLADAGMDDRTGSVRELRAANG